jgi:hypothetical protein
MKRSQVYSLLFIFFMVMLLMNILALSSHQVITDSKCDSLIIQNDSLQYTLDTMVAK